MRTFKTIAVSITATLLLAGAPGAHAQTQDDLRLMQAFLSIMTDYFEIIESTYDVASSPEKAAIMQMQKIKEVYEERGEKVRSVEVLSEILDRSSNPAIRNAAFMLLGDTLKDAGRTDEALEYLRRGLAENIQAAE
ncbi:MAG: hypothetical protein WBN65_11850 [Gammaproteobacteria bacterium]